MPNEAASPYSVSKLAHHPHLIEAFRRGEFPPPTQIHLMWQNRCNHDCHFCSYRMSNWKNSTLFDDSEAVPWDLMQRTLREAKSLGVKAIELTGGGEPTMYPKYDDGIELIDEFGFDLGIVTNGVTMSAARAQRFGQVNGWKWARVSIDAGTESTYCAVRRVTSTHWTRAWNAVSKLAEARDLRRNPEIRVGVGFVVTRENHAEVYDFCRMAKEHGADNVRLAVRFGPDGVDYYLPGQLDIAEEQAGRSIADFDCETFRINDLISERRKNIAADAQNYEPCYTMRLLCVIGGDSKVYSCCSLAFDPRGLLGDLRKNTLTEVWQADSTRRFSVRARCNVPCLYESRNRAMIGLVEGTLPVAPNPNQPHINFI